MKFLNPALRLFLVFVQITGLSAGCTTLAELKKNRDLPKGGSVSFDPKKQEFWYDRSVRAYRHALKDKEHGHPRLEAVVRDHLGKKVQREEELIALSDAHSSVVLGTGTKIGTITGVAIGVGGIVAATVIFLPCVIAFNLVKDIVFLPFLPISSHLETRYVEESERVYTEGRAQFEASAFNSALAHWDHAKQLMPNLQALSDVDFWRGRAFDALHQPEEALTAYATFLSYSESSVPSYFKAGFPSDPTWEWKADQAEGRIAEFIAGGALGGPVVVVSNDSLVRRR